MGERGGVTRVAILHLPREIKFGYALAYLPDDVADLVGGKESRTLFLKGGSL